MKHHWRVILLIMAIALVVVAVILWKKMQAEL